MAVEKFIHGKRDNRKHEGLAATRRRIIAAIMQEEDFAEQFSVSMAVWQQRDNLPKEMVDYHRHILEEWGFLPKSGIIFQDEKNP